MGRSSSSSSTTTLTSNNQRQASMDASRNQGTAITAGGNVIATDGGAVKGALEYAERISEHNTWLRNEQSKRAAEERDRANERAAQMQANYSNNITGLSKNFSENMTTLSANHSNNMAGLSLEAMDYVGNAFDKSLAALGEDRTAQYEQQAQVLAGVASASRSETASALDTITKYFFGAIALVGGIYALGRLK